MVTRQRRALAGWGLRWALVGALSLVFLTVGGSLRPLCERPDCRDPSGPDPIRTGSPLPMRVTIGRLPTLWPGMSAPVDLTIENPNPRTARITTVDLIVSDVRTSEDLDPGTNDRACPVSSFRSAIGHLDTEIDPGGSLSLLRSTIPQQRWPQLAMLDSATNQDACQGVSLVVVASVRGLLL